MAKKLLKTLIAGAAVAGVAYAAYKNKDKISEIKNKVTGASDDDIFDDDFDEDFDEDDIDEDDTDTDDNVEMYDTTDDGNIDTVAIDRDGDGRPDEIMEDTTGDGKVDTAFVDTTGDGIVDTVVDLTKEEDE